MKSGKTDDQNKHWSANHVQLKAGTIQRFKVPADP